MEVIIDGYNLLKSVYPGKNKQLDKQRIQLLRELAYYKQKREGVSKIVLVYDGGTFPHAQREVHHGVVVMFAGFKSSADTWIKGYIQRNSFRELLLVSNDRELIKAAEKHGADAYPVGLFYQRLQDVLLEKDENTQARETDTRKFENETEFEFEQQLEDLDQAGLDLLMEQASLYRVDKIIDDEPVRERKGSAQTISKKEKRIAKKIKKL